MLRYWVGVLLLLAALAGEAAGGLSGTGTPGSLPPQRGGAAEVRSALALHAAPSVVHDYLVRLGEGSGEVFFRLAVAPQLVPQILRLVDTDGNGTITAAERQGWLERYLAGLHFTMDDQPVAMGVVGASALDEPLLLNSIRKPITVTLQLTYTLPLDPPGKTPADHHFVLSDNTNYVNYDEYYASWEDAPGAVTLSHDLTQPANPATFESIVERDPTTHTPTAAPPTSAGDAGLPLSQEAAMGQYGAWLQGFLENPDGNPWLGLGLFLLAVGLGGLHALTPGHGKSVVAAYLVGSRGRVRDALALGGIVTLTHTSSVLVLGAALLAITNFGMPRWLQPALEVLSGLLVILVGLYTLATRLRALQSGDTHTHHSHDPNDPHSHSHGSAQSHDHSHTVQPTAHGSPPTARGSRTGLRDLLALGISGGLVPCPDALAILFLTLYFHQGGLGLALVSSFSIGLAAVLMGIGVLMVRARGLLERLLPGGDHGPGWVRFLPVVSAVLVIGLGLALLLGAALGQRWV
ncbi:MAG: hypothetical protein M3Z04_06300 [Chloroflexota bacterium]|nr:hypothetical protein [Chloroflexota bacterium]